MVYRAIGAVSNPQQNRLDLVMVQFEVSGQNWTYELKHTAALPYTAEWSSKLANAALLSAAAYLQLHTAYGHLLANSIKQFIKDNALDYQVQLIGNGGHPVFEQAIYHLGDSAVIAAITGVNVVSDFKPVDAALGGTANDVFAVAKKLLPVAEPTEFSQALYTAFFAVLRWREENNVHAADTGAARDSIGGAVWVGQEW